MHNDNYSLKFANAQKRPGQQCGAADSRTGWRQLVPNSFQSVFILSGDGPSTPLLARILESAVNAAGRQ